MKDDRTRFGKVFSLFSPVIQFKTKVQLRMTLNLCGTNVKYKQELCSTLSAHQYLPSSRNTSELLLSPTGTHILWIFKPIDFLR